MPVRRLSFLPLALLVSCATAYSPPSKRTHDARLGFYGGNAPLPGADVTCSSWRKTFSKLDRYAKTHVSYPELDLQRSCYTRITHIGRTVQVGRIPEGCAGPTPEARESLRALAAKLEQAPEAQSDLFPCSLSPRQRAAASLQNARAFRAAAESLGSFPYAAMVIPGYGEKDQRLTSVANWMPGDECHEPEPADLSLFGAMVPRTERAHDALSAGVAPLAIVSGGTPHSAMVEAFAMLYLLECVEHVPREAVVVEPCAEHTHTNLRNSARWLVAMGERTGYLLTDDSLQSDYLQDVTLFDYIGGSIDQRSLRDWGYVIGSWRQASVGIEAGFWFTPYRFWAEPRDGIGSMTCVGH